MGPMGRNQTRQSVSPNSPDSGAGAKLLMGPMGRNQTRQSVSPNSPDSGAGAKLLSTIADALYMKYFAARV